jgi:hypothetical protein
MRQDLTGQIFGLLTAIRAGKKRYWICRCKCGNIKEICSGDLRNGHTQSCGCMSHIWSTSVGLANPLCRNLTGQVFGRLTVMGYAGSSDGAVWFCKCSCGQEKKIKGCWLWAGSIKSCGCLRREAHHVTHGFARRHKTRYAFYSAIVGKANRRGIVPNFSNFERRYIQWSEARSQKKAYQAVLQHLKLLQSTL